VSFRRAAAGDDRLVLERDVAPGIHRIEDSYTNWYLVEDGDRITIVDAGVPSSWSSLVRAMRDLGRGPDAIDALVLTHAHFDHIGFAERARRGLGIAVHVHENDLPLTRKPRLYGRERSPLHYAATKPKAMPIVLSFLVRGAFWPTPIEEVEPFREGAELSVAGSPRVVFTPGHTLGHCALHFPDRDAVIAGDAVVTLNPYTGETGAQIVAQAATADSHRNLETLDALAATGARTVLTGHGEPWRDGVEAIVERARARGIT
jgi:glyoxylase-like metal-dependent hydrolase (beta-lactamase superfamily II)